MLSEFIPYLAPAGLLLAVLAAAVRILPEYERGVVFFLGRFQKVKGPGLVIIIPGIQVMRRVDLRVITLDVPSQDVISRDNVTVSVNAVLYYRVVDPERAIIRVENYGGATTQLAQTLCVQYSASTIWMKCFQNVTSSMRIFRRYWMRKRRNGGLKCQMSRSSTSISVRL